MAKARKFGTFGGVFTPSILTILGVIMYLRLPYIVGQAGLYQTLGIILVAHIISIATGLSVSSIATDKKVRAGGTYYMISRSLGLPIGGTLGLALFVGMSFSISLYLIGFSESFLSYWGLPTDVNAIRISGSIALAGVTIIALISTAFALKMQYWIMAAIVLSLISVLFGRHELAPAAPLLQPVVDAEPFIVLFGIFFPAVTGFEAGVSMSGDLRDPKKSIPYGTMAAIAVGLFVYMGLAAFFAWTVSAEQLSGNVRVLLDIALFSPVVVAGIWGATISSAFGSILGAPRILQATADDGVAPRWFARGHGADNEPRRALIVACIIAEAGILVGELNAIARIVSMFFITAYGFLNLTATIESWVSPDFRPEFRVPKIFGLIGAAACFIVMIQLDLLAMVGASVLLLSLYLYLARKQLRLESGDTWEGVWSSLARTALLRLDRIRVERRNWKPNLLLFSGGAEARPHLVELGGALAGKRGLITDIELSVDGSAADRIEPAALPPPQQDAEDESVFRRRVRCHDVYDGMHTVATHYGFAGLEPNTVLLGWARTAAQPERFSTLVHQLAEEDLNVLLLDFDRDRGWGSRSSIDVWWRLSGNDVAFSLALVRAITQAAEWSTASVRFLTVNDGDPAFSAAIAREMYRVLADYRVEAAVRVIGNTFEKRSFPEVVRHESTDADLTIIGVADVGAADGATHWIEETDGILDRIGTTLVVHASSFFDEPLIRLPSALATLEAGDTVGGWEPAAAAYPEVDLDPEITGIATRLDADLDEALSGIWEDYVAKALRAGRSIAVDVGDIARSAIEHAFEFGRDEGRTAVAPVVERVLHRIDAARSEDALVQGGLIQGLADAFPGRVARSGLLAPETLELTAAASTFGQSDGASLRVHAIQTWLRVAARARRRPVTWSVEPRAIAIGQLSRFAAEAVDEMVHAAGADAARAVGDAHRLFDVTMEALAAAPDGAAAGAALRSATEEIAENARLAEFRLRNTLARLRTATVHDFSTNVLRVDAGTAVRNAEALRDRARVRIAELEEAVGQWRDVQPLIVNGIELDARLAMIREAVQLAGNRARRDARRTAGEIAETLERMERTLAAGESDAADTALEIAATLQTGFDPAAVFETARAIVLDASARLPDAISILADEAAEPVREGAFEQASAIEVSIRRVVEYLTETALFGPLRHEMATFAPAFEDAAAAAREVAQLAAFHVRSREDDAEQETMAAPSTERLRGEIGRLEQRASDLDALIARRFADALHRFEAPDVVRVSSRLDEYVRSQRGREVIGGLRRTVAHARERMSTAAVRLVYGRSEGALLASRLRRDAAGHAGLEALREIVQTASPRPDVLARLPLFYRELFLGRPNITSDIHIGFDSELAEAAMAVEQHRKGRSGALLILGQPGQGRATLASIVAHQHFDADRIIRVEPPHGGSIDARVFSARLRSALGGTGDLATRLGRVPGAVVLLNDINLWWERSPNGGAVIDTIGSLITRHGDGLLFILNTNQYAYRLMDRIQPLEHLLLRLIECEPFSAEQLQRLILLRHGATGLRFTLRNVPEEQLSQWRLARLFNAIFENSGGNIGAALNAWVAGITRVHEDGFELDRPRRPSLYGFETLTRMQRMLAVQIVIHERLTTTRLQRITGLDQATLSRELRGLIRPGVVSENEAGVIRVDRYVRPHLVRFLERSELL